MKIQFAPVLIVLCALIGVKTSARAADFDIILRGGWIYDGSGRPPMVGDLGIKNDTIAAVGELGGQTARKEIDASGLAVAPGFINMLTLRRHLHLAFAQRRKPVPPGAG